MTSREKAKHGSRREPARGARRSGEARTALPAEGGREGAPLNSEAEASYEALLEKVTAFWEEAVRRQPGAFPCGPGCTHCCRAHLSVLPLEAARIRAALTRLPPTLRTRLAAHVADPPDPEACVFLIEERCAIYEARPIICRTHGLAVRTEEGIGHCPLCFTEEPPRPEGILSVDTINTLVVLIGRRWLLANGIPEDAPREALASLARLACGQGE